MTDEVTISKSETSNNNNNNYYLLRVNLSGFNLNDVKVNVIEENSINKIEITATSIENDEKGKLKSSKEYKKVFELQKKSCSGIKFETMETCFDDDKKHLIVKFQSNKPETHVISLLNNSSDDDVYVDLIEKTAKNLQSLKTLDDIKDAIESVLNQSNFNFNHNKKADNRKSEREAFNDDMHLLSQHNSSPAMHTIANDDGSKLLRVNVKIPHSITAVVNLPPSASSTILSSTP